MNSFNSLHINGLYNNIKQDLFTVGEETHIRDNLALSLDHVTARLDNITERVLHNTIFDIKFALSELYCILNEHEVRFYLSEDQLNRTMGGNTGIVFFGAEMREALSKWSLFNTYNLLKQNIHTNRAYLDLNTRRPTKHVPCLIGFHLYVRNNKLHGHLITRGTELNYGFLYDTFIFTQIQDMIFNWLCRDYPDLERGSFYYTTTNLHIYVDSDHNPIIEGKDLQNSLYEGAMPHINDFSYQEYFQQMSMLNSIIEYLYKHRNYQISDPDNGVYAASTEARDFYNNHVHFLAKPFKVWAEFLDFYRSYDNEVEMQIYYRHHLFNPTLPHGKLYYIDYSYE
jgi:hypothetical protein